MSRRNLSLSILRLVSASHRRQESGEISSQSSSSPPALPNSSLKSTSRMPHLANSSVISSSTRRAMARSSSSSACVATPIAVIWESLIMGSPSSSLLRLNSTTRLLSAVPSGTPYFLEKLPAATLRTMTSTITMSAFRTSTVVSSMTRTRCVRTPFFAR